MRKLIFGFAVLLVAASGAAAQRNAPHIDWDDPFELKSIRAGFASLKVPEKTEPVGSAPQLLNRKRADLETLYRNSSSGPIPDGKSNGVATLSAGTPAGRASEALFSIFWHGKVFDRRNGVLVNRLIVGRVVKAKVFLGPSWLDGKPSVIIDYQGTSWVAGAIRDEIREVAPGVYLGFAYVRAPDGGEPRADILFALDFNDPSVQPPNPGPLL